MISAPYFLATKLAAFDTRGKGDFLLSHDMEDIVAVLDGRGVLVDEVRKADAALRSHLAKRFSSLVDDQRFIAALAGHLPGDEKNQERLPMLIQTAETIATIK